MVISRALGAPRPAPHTPVRSSNLDASGSAAVTAVQCRLLAISGLFEVVRRTFALPLKADIVGARTVRTQKADIERDEVRPR